MVLLSVISRSRVAGVGVSMLVPTNCLRIALLTYSPRLKSESPRTVARERDLWCAFRRLSAFQAPVAALVEHRVLAILCDGQALRTQPRAQSTCDPRARELKMRTR